MTRMQVYIPDEMFSDLKRYARINEVAMSEVVRKGLDKVLGKKKTTNLKFGEGFFGAGKGGPKDLSTKIDYYLYGEGSKWGKK